MSPMMSLAEAMRLGAMSKPQTFGVLYHDGKTCAMGAALDAVGMRFDSEWTVNETVAAWNKWAVVLTKAVCPACPATANVGSLVGHLNDHHTWTREQIADWIDTIDQPAPVQDVRIEVAVP